jgi:RNA polymerase subunit RPABC4/transcription elongation factor Spt4
MAFCASCGTKLDEGARFCPSCGTPVGGGAPVASPAPATEKVGSIRKCPACGAEVPAMAAVCPDCGHEFSGVKVNSAVQAFFEKLDAIDQQLYEENLKKDEKAPIVGGAFGALLGPSLKMMAEVAGGPSAGIKRKLDMIEGFPIPNSKEDILEFIILATSRIKSTNSGWMASYANLMKGKSYGEQKEEAQFDRAWKTKCEQAYAKAKIAFGSDKEALEQITSLLKEKKIIK